MEKVNKKNGKKIKSKFVSCNKYPMSWGWGIMSMLNMLMCDPEDKEKLELDNLDRFEEELSGAIIGWIDNIIVEVE